jgi:hypothetical protein
MRDLEYYSVRLRLSRRRPYAVVRSALHALALAFLLALLLIVLLAVLFLCLMVVRRT